MGYRSVLVDMRSVFMRRNKWSPSFCLKVTITHLCIKTTVTLGESFTVEKEDSYPSQRLILKTIIHGGGLNAHFTDWGGMWGCEELNIPEVMQPERRKVRTSGPTASVLLSTLHVCCRHCFADHKIAVVPTGLAFTIQAQEQTMLEGDALPGNCAPLYSSELEPGSHWPELCHFLLPPTVVSDGTGEPQIPSKFQS